MKDSDWMKNVDPDTVNYIVGLQKINKSLVEILKIYGGLLKKVRVQNENHEEIEKAIGNIDNVMVSAEKLDFLRNVTRH
ncbi:MAG: hypothetical protein JRI71_12135 [Deltaproteobacteria bacterium]|nr:hypothetical protein [Deltaproteobacteria bacterium]